MSSVSSSSTLAPRPKKPAIAISEVEEDDEVLIPSLPNDVALNCLARVPRSKHPTLSLVSKPIRSLLFSPRFFDARSSTEPIPYVICYDFGRDHYRWFTLYRNPFNSIHSDLLLPIPVPPVPPYISLHDAAYAVLGTNIYVISSTKNSYRPSSSWVWVLDCRINRWRRGPTMLAARRAAVANVLDGKIYVIGVTDSTIQAEVLDPELGKWVELVCPFTIDPEMWYLTRIEGNGNPSFVKDGELYIYVAGKVATFNPQGKGSWRFTDMPRCYSGSLFMDGIFYFCNYKGIHWFDEEEQVWKVLKYLDNKVLPMWVPGSRCALTYAAGNLILLGGNKGKNNNEISYTEIQVTKRDGQLWGKVCCSQIIFPTPPSTFYVHKCLAVDL